MKKTLLIFAVMLIGFCVFAGGSSEKEPEIIVTQDYIGNKHATKVVKLLTSPASTIASTTASSAEWAREVQTEWAEANPDWAIEILYRDPNSISVAMSKALTETQMGIGPDFMDLDSFYMGVFLDANAIQPLDGLIPQEELDQWFDWTEKVTVRDGKHYALWGETDARLLHYRTDLVPNPPRTWDEVIEIGSKINEETGKHGFLTPSNQSEASSNEGTWPYFWAQGGTIFGENSRPILGEGSNRQKLINIYAYQKELIDSGAAPQEIASMNMTNMMSEVGADNVAMMIHGTWAVNQIPGIAPDPSVWSYTAIPQMEADQYSNTCGGWVWAILTDDPEKQEIAASYMMYTMGSKEAMARRCLAQGQIPVREDVFGSPEFVNNEHMQNFLVEFRRANTRPASSMYPIVSDINAKQLGKVLTGELTPEEAVDQLQELCLVEWEVWKNQQN